VKRATASGSSGTTSSILRERPFVLSPPLAETIRTLSESTFLMSQDTSHPVRLFQFRDNQADRDSG